MRILTKIAKNELRHLFYSPVAWFLSIVMLVISAVFYTNLVYFMAKSQALAAKIAPGQSVLQMESLTTLLFNQNSFFTTVLQQLYLFVPLLTMGVINREFNNGTIKLLYSSPVKLRQIVLGKYLAMTLYCLLLIGICGIFVLMSFADIKSPDLPPLLSASLGLFLLLSAFTAIGFFMSSLTSYQIVAAIASFTLLFVLSKIGGLWQQYEFVRDLTWFLSIEGRTEKMIKGLITSKDILYYLVIICMFVSFTYLKLKDAMETQPWYIRTARYLLVTLTGITIGYAGSQPATTLYLDTTAQQIRTVHPNTQSIIRQMNEGPLEVTLYTNIFHQGIYYGLPKQRNRYLSELWEQYQRFKPDIHFRYEYFYAVPKGDSSLFKTYPGKSLKQIAGIVAKSFQVDSALFKPVESMQDSSMLESEHYRLVMKLSYKGRTAILRTFNEIGIPWPTQQNVSASLSRLLDAPIPKLYFATGQLERSIYKKGEREYHMHTLDKFNIRSLINNGFDADTLNLNTQDIPASTAVLVLADPKMDLPLTVINKLHSYVQSGGNMLILGEPGKQYVTNPFLQEIGIQLKAGQLVQSNANETPDKIASYLTKDALDLADEKQFLLMKRAWAHDIRKDSFWATLSGATSLSVSDKGFEVKPLLMTGPHRSWLKAGKLVSDSAMPVFMPQDGDSREVSDATGIQLTRRINQKEQRIIVTGDADMFSSLRGSSDLISAFFSWSSFNKFPVYTPYPYAKDNTVKVSPERAVVQRVVFTWIFPSLALITATIILIRRKRK